MEVANKFEVKLVDVSVNGVPSKNIDNKALVFNGSEIIRFVKNSFILVEPENFEKSTLAYFKKNYPKNKFIEIRNYDKVFSQALHFTISTNLKKTPFIKALELVIFNSYMSDYNLGVGINVKFTDGTQFLLNNYDEYPTIRKLDLNFSVTLDKLKPTIEDYLNNKVAKTIEFFSSQKDSFESNESFISEYYSTKNDTGKYLSIVSNINGFIGLTEFCDEVSGDAAKTLGLLRYNYEKSVELGSDFYFYNRYYKTSVKKISEFIWK